MIVGELRRAIKDIVFPEKKKKKERRGTSERMADPFEEGSALKFRNVFV